MKLKLATLLLPLILLSSCDKEQIPDPRDPETAEKAIIDRFSETAATLYIRDPENGFPEPNQPINFDQDPFITKGLGPHGEFVTYYNFDVQPLSAAPIYVFFVEGENIPVEGQLNVIDVIPGDEGYNDLWHVIKVIVPDDYVPNTVSSYQDIVNIGYPVEASEIIVNCPVVPEGSSASLRYRETESKITHRGWYKGKIVQYFKFEEKELSANLPVSGSPLNPISGILVTFNINPDQEGGGPSSGPLTEQGTMQTHNVLETLPEDELYSPLWSVSVYDNADFPNVSDWQSAINANILVQGVMLVNCPVVLVDSAE